MSIASLTLRDLEYVVAVAEHGHFGKAAGACNVSQPALSAQIRKIEDVLGVQLFERSNRRVAITAVGEAVVAQSIVVLEEAEKIMAVSRREQLALTGQLRVGAIATLGPYLLPHLLPALRKDFPKLELFLREGLTQGLLTELKSGKLDAVLASDTFTDPALGTIKLFFEPFCLAVPRKHPLAVKQPLLGKDLRAEDMVLLEDGHCLRDQSLDICPPNRRGRVRQLHATSLETLRHLVATGAGYTLVPQLAVQASDPLRKLIRYRQFPDREVGRNIILVFRNRYARMSDLEALAAFIRAHLPKGVMPISG